MKPHASRAERSLTLAIAGLGAGLALAALGRSAIADPPPRHAPPPEAYTACEGKAAGAACSVPIHDTDVTGTCAAPPGESRLACRPDRPPSPPAEAFTACDGKTSGVACTVQAPDREVSGTCGNFPGDTRLVCVPKDLPAP